LKKLKNFVTLNKAISSNNKKENKMDKVEFLKYTPFHDDQYILGIIALRLTVLLGTHKDGTPRWGKEIVRYKHVKTKSGGDFFTSGSFGVTECGEKKYLPTSSFDSLSDNEDLIEFIKKRMNKDYAQYLVAPSALAAMPMPVPEAVAAPAAGTGGAPAKTDDLPF
jgi:hypothetical protein